jgi:hypothetical protein
MTRLGRSTTILCLVFLSNVAIKQAGSDKWVKAQ